MESQELEEAADVRLKSNLEKKTELLKQLDIVEQHEAQCRKEIDDQKEAQRRYALVYSEARRDQILKTGIVGDIIEEVVDFTKTLVKVCKEEHSRFHPLPKPEPS